VSQARAEWRLKRNGKSLNSLWGFENWDKEGKEEHHIGRKKYSDRTILIPVSMHRELTRRQMEEHPAEGPDPSNPLQRHGRLFLGLADILECLADALRWIGECLIETAKHEERHLKEPVEIPEYLALRQAKCRSALYPAGLSFPPYGLMQHINLTWDELDRVRLLTLKLSSRL
jgi:hypothetical protein